MYDFQNIDIAIRASSLIYSTFLCVLLLLLYFFVFGIQTSRKSNIKSTVPSLILAIVIIMFITFSIGADKYPYYLVYENIALNGLPTDWLEINDFGWRLLTFVISKFCFNEVGYFLVIAIFYVFSNRYFCLKNTQYSNYLFVAIVTFMGFFSYGVNTIRAGVALSVLLIAMDKIDRSKWLFIIIVMLAIHVHKSIAIPAVAVVITSYSDRPKIYVVIWILCLITSFATGGAIKEYIVQYLGEEDVRVSSYIGANEYENYNVGFRWDFIVYSFFPIAIGIYHILKSKIADKGYRRIFNVYVLTNAFWLLVIAVPFSDRFAYLSWFLYPYVLLLPYLGRGGLQPQIKTAVLLTIGVGGFNIMMSFLR